MSSLDSLIVGLVNFTVASTLGCFVIVPVTSSLLSRIRTAYTGKSSDVQSYLYKASCWDCNEFYTGKTKRGLHHRKSEHYKPLNRELKHARF